MFFSQFLRRNWGGIDISYQFTGRRESQLAILEISYPSNLVYIASLFLEIQ